MRLPGFRRKAISAKRTVEVGWVVDTPEAAFIWQDPKPVTRAETFARHAKSVTRCPAIADHESRLFEIPCPFDLRLRFGLTEGGEPGLYDAAADQSGFNPAALSQVVTLVPPPQWRHPERPVIEIQSPYRFVSDEDVHITQLPPFLHYRDPSLPGLLIAGRFPIHIWPRKLNWAFEWYDTKRDLILTRGEPWFYLRFDGTEGNRPVRLVEAELTPALVAYCAGIDGVVKYVNHTYSLFPVAQKRRPLNLVVPRRLR